MGQAEHRHSQGELRKAVTWFGAVLDHAADALFVVEVHGGRLWAEANAPQVGVFALSLPVGS